MRRHKRGIAILLMLAVLFGMFSYMPEIASAVSDLKDINPPFGASLRFSDGGAYEDGVSLGRWTVYVNGRATGDSLVVTDYFEDGQGGGYWQSGAAWNLIHISLKRSWEEAVTPFPSPTGYYEGASFSRNVSGSARNWSVQYNGTTSSRFHIRELAESLGCYVDYDERAKAVYITTSNFPSGAIEHPSVIKDKQPITIQIRGTAYSSNIREYKFYVGSTLAAEGRPTSKTFNDTATVTIPAGKRLLTLHITDTIGRTTTYSKYVDVEGIPQEPPDEPGDPGGPPSGGPVADFTMPAQAADWDPVPIKNTSKAPPGGRIVDVEWEVSTSRYEGELGFDGGTLYFERPNRTYDVTLTVWDDKGRSDSITKSIFISEWVPPEPPKPDAPTVELSINKHHFEVGETAEFIVTINPNGYEIVGESWRMDNNTTGDIETEPGLVPSTMVMKKAGEYEIYQSIRYLNNRGVIQSVKSNIVEFVVEGEEEPEEPLEVDFMAIPSEQYIDEPIELINTSKGYVEEEWYIRKAGDDSYENLNLDAKNEFTRNEIGTYDIKLVVRNGKGQQKEKVKQVRFKEMEPLTVDFDTIPSKTTIGSDIQLINKSTGYSHGSWHIKKVGDSIWNSLGVSKEGGVFTRGEAGKYDVRLTVTNYIEEKSLIKQVEFTEPNYLTAFISALPPSTYVGQPIKIENRSFGEYTNYQWYLDGNPVSWSKSGTTLTEHTPKTRTIRLEISDDNGNTDSATRTVSWADVSLNAKIAANKTTAMEGEAIYISNHSTGDYDEWTWRVNGQERPWGKNGGMFIAEAGSTTVSLTIRHSESGKTDTASLTISAKKPNIPPRAVIVAPNYVVRGETINIKDLSSDLDGTITNRQWRILGTDQYDANLKTDGSGGIIVVDDFTTITVELTVRDNEGATDTDTAKIVVGGNEPPEIRLSESGTKKQNRKYSIDLSGSTTGAYYEIDWNKMNFAVIPLTDGIDEAAIKSVRQSKGIDLLFKEPGAYRIRATIEDTGGRTDSQELEVLIAPDEPPVNNILLDKTNVYRDEIIQVVKEINSPDDDVIQVQDIKLYYDSNNNGSFADEMATDISGNQILVFNKVGRYKVVSFVKEEFGQETIEQFVSDDDRRTATFETIIQVDNRPPTAEIKADVPSKKEKVDLLILLDSRLDNGSEYYYIKTGVDLPNRNYIRNNLTVINNILATKNIDARTFKKDFKVDVYEKDISENRIFHFYTTDESNMPATVGYSDQQGYNGTLHKQPGVTWTTKYTNVSSNFTKVISKNNSTQNNSIFDTNYYVNEDKIVLVNPATGYTKSVRFSGYIPRTSVNWTPQYNYYHQDVTETVVKNNPTQDNSVFDSQLWYNQGGYSGYLSRIGVDWTTNYDKKFVTDYRISSPGNNDFPSTISYNSDGYTGILLRDGSPFVIGGSASDTKTVTIGPIDRAVVEHSYGTYNGGLPDNSFSYDKKRTVPVSPYMDGGKKYRYDSGGYSGILERVDWSYRALVYRFKSSDVLDVGKEYLYADSIQHGAVFEGTVTGPDTRIWQQNYSGQVQKIKDYTGTATYSGTVTRSEFSHYRGTATYSGSLSATTTDGYYGESNYQGTVYRHVPDTSEPSWRTEAKKYILYVADNNGMNDLARLQDYQKKSGAKVIYIGPSDYSGAVKNIRYSSLADNIEEALEFIAVEEALETRDAVLINEEPFTLEVEDDDPENDPIVERAFKYEHDPNVYFNPEGQSSLPSTWSTYRATTLDKPGKYVISYRVKDQVSTEPNFEEYNKYSNIAQIVLFGHRRPVVTDFNVNFEYNPATRKYENPDFLVSAYDPDYYDINNFRGRADKGIKEYAYEWKKKNESEFKYGIPNSLDAGTYVFKVMARDIDDAWSLPFEKEVVLSEMEFILKGLFDPEDAKFNPAVGIPASEQLRVRYIETIHAHPVNSVEFSLYQGGSPKTPIKMLTNPANVVLIDKSLIQWEPIRYYQIPETLPDGSYVATLTARAGNVYTSIHWDMKVVTPVDLEINVPAELYTDETNRITATTSKYVNKVTMQFDSKTYNLSLVRNVGDKKEWKYDLFLPEGFPLGEYTVSITATTPNGNSETKTAKVIVEDPLMVIGDSEKDTYMAGQAMLLNAYTEGRAYKVEAKVWFKNKHTNTDVTELIPERFLGDPPEKEMEWRTRRYKDDPGGRDLVVIIPPDMPDGTYEVQFTAYKESADGTIKTAHDTVTVKVKGVVYDRSYSEIIGGPR